MLPVETKQKLLIEIERLRNYAHIKRWSEPLLRNVELARRQRYLLHLLIWRVRFDLD